MNTKKYNQKEYQKEWTKNICLQMYSLANTVLNSEPYTV